MRFGVFNMSMRVIELALVEKQLCQVIINQELSEGEIGRGSYPEGCLEVVDGLLRLILGGVYQTKETVAHTDQRSINSFSEEVDRLRRGFFCSVELPVIIQQLGEVTQSRCSSACIIEPFVNF